MDGPKGYHTGYSYCGYMPNGEKAYFATDKEYLEAYWEEVKASLFFAYLSMLMIAKGGERRYGI